MVITSSDDEYRIKGTTPPPPPCEPTPGFELIVGPADGVIDNADVVVRWCVSPELVKQLEDKKVAKPMVLLETCNSEGEIGWRGIVPLGDLSTYARFYQAGEMKLFAMIFDAGLDINDSKAMERDFMKRDSGNWRWMLQYDGKLEKDIRNENVLGVTVATIEIPAGVFGKEPSPWVKWYTNLWHDHNHPAEDQCEYRRRKILAFGIKWIPVTLYVLWYSIVGFLAVVAVYLAGFKDWITNWKAAFHPFDGSWKMLLDSSEGEYGDLRDSRYVIWKKWEYTRDQPFWTMLALSPAALLIYAFFPFMIAEGEWWWYDMHVWTANIAMVVVSIVAAIDAGTTAMYLIYDKAKEKDDTSHGNMFGGGIMIAIVVGVIYAITANAPLWAVAGLWTLIAGLILVVVLFGQWTTIFTNFSLALDRASIWLEDLLFGKAGNDYTEIRELLCPKDHLNLSTDINDIPKERRTWRLRVRNLKAKICRPMQR